MNHSKGPWKIDEDVDDLIRPDWPLTVVGSNGEQICITGSDEFCSNYIENASEVLANARLIAAAPDLLAALKLMADDLESEHQCENPTCSLLGDISDARALLARLEGT
jgi:hypothetical protein